MRYLGIITALLLGLLAPALAQQIPALSVLPPDLAASHPALPGRRAELVQERATLHGKINGLNARCAAVEEGSAAEASCQHDQAELSTALNSHIQKSNDFNAAVRAAIAAPKRPAITPPAQTPPALLLDVAGAWSRKFGAISIHEPPTPWIEGKSWTGKIRFEGTFQITTADGNVITQDNPEKVASLSLANARVVTGNASMVQFLLPDETTFQLGPNSDMVMDNFVYDPSTGLSEIAAQVSKGMFRWVTGKLAHEDPAGLKVKLAVGTIGPRGTDFEVYVGEDARMSNLPPALGQVGFIVQYSGEIVITPNSDSQPRQAFVLDAGHYIDFSNGKFDTKNGPSKCSDPDCSEAFRDRGWALR